MSILELEVKIYPGGSRVFLKTLSPCFLTFSPVFWLLGRFVGEVKMRILVGNTFKTWLETVVLPCFFFDILVGRLVWLVHVGSLKVCFPVYVQCGCVAKTRNLCKLPQF